MQLDNSMLAVLGKQSLPYLYTLCIYIYIPILILCMYIYIYTYINIMYVYIYAYVVSAPAIRKTWCLGGFPCNKKGSYIAHILHTPPCCTWKDQQYQQCGWTQKFLPSQTSHIVKPIKWVIAPLWCATGCFTIWRNRKQSNSLLEKWETLVLHDAWMPSRCMRSCYTTTTLFMHWLYWLYWLYVSYVSCVSSVSYVSYVS